MPPSSLPLVKLPPKAVVHRFGAPTSAPSSSALLRFPAQGWTINRESAKPEGWAIVGDAGGRKLAVETLLSRHRIQPLSPPPGPFPYITSLISSSTDSLSSTAEAPSKPIRHLAFARPPATGEFTDFTARYGALLEEDRLTYRETLQNLHPRPSDEDIERVANLMRIGHLLDLPSVSFSSGQTRKGRIASVLLTKPVLLLLEDPMAGLDVPSRKEISKLLGELNASEVIKIVLVLRGKGGEEMPKWITDVAEVRNGEVWIGKREEYEQKHAEEQFRNQAMVEKVVEKVVEKSDEVPGEPVIKLDGVSVSYGEGTRQVLKDIKWTIKPGEKWHLIGANGSGKTTLLSLILGHHPRSYSLPPSSLLLFSKPRRSIPSPTLRTLIGHTSPEVYASFPRGMGLTALEAVGSGFEGVFSRRKLSPEQKERVKYLLEYFKDLLKPSSVSGRPTSDVTVQEIANRNFAHFTPSQQGLLLFLRAIVRKPKLLILDEPSQGMDEVIWERCRRLLEKEWEGEGKDMAVIVVSHYEDEVPWKKGRGKVFKLDQGIATVQ
ncbi:hypothetical protein I314_03475 [Cryptococcus bacillisporus CA1873]|uniref:ABC transporter domain-containing protein n=1 Tax=Cryptococcus bacillisporus CA1873 TaxID=1296111 RepID=A0ABR5BBW9_CRYGA|nr:hypothetical protein I314_03475 [Cryptococcus bacillisporus CA1873]|eukprot:KIR62530.1 hypothetical protein I314_03475 [Cryptococcus gattii CA1873]